MQEDKANGKMETLLGGAEIEVTKLDGSKDTVKVRQVPLREMSKYAAALADEGVMVELFCAKPEGWSGTLTNESFELVIETGERINESFFGRWIDRQKRRAERINPGAIERFSSQITSGIASPSPASPPSKPSN